MDIKAFHPNFKIPTRGTDSAGGFDIYMPEGGVAVGDKPTMVALGFATQIPPGYVALLLPRSGAGAKYGVELNNTCGVIDADYRGEWKAAIRTKSGEAFSWEAGDRIVQFVLVPVLTPDIQVVEELGDTARGAGGFGHTG